MWDKESGRAKLLFGPPTLWTNTRSPQCPVIQAHGQLSTKSMEHIGWDLNQNTHPDSLQLSHRYNKHSIWTMDNNWPQTQNRVYLSEQSYYITMEVLYVLDVCFISVAWVFSLVECGKTNRVVISISNQPTYLGFPDSILKREGVSHKGLRSLVEWPTSKLNYYSPSELAEIWRSCTTRE